MKLPEAKTLSEIAKLLGNDFIGNPDLKITGLNELHRIEEGDIAFCDNEKYYKKTLNSAATVVLIDKKTDCPEGKGLIICKAPFDSYNLLTQHFSKSPFSEGENKLEKNEKDSKIHPSVIMGESVEIGKNCIIYPNVIIYDGVKIGNNVTIHAGAIIGADAFYYKKKKEGYDKMLSSGKVIIEDNVDIGAGATIDRGVSSQTIIGKGTKIDNQVQIGHDTILGKNCLIAAQVGIAGCVDIGDNVTLWGQVGIASGISIGDNVILLAQSGVSKSLKGDTVYFGYPADEAKKKLKEMAYIRKIPDLMAKLK